MFKKLAVLICSTLFLVGCAGMQLQLDDGFKYIKEIIPENLVHKYGIGPEIGEGCMTGADGTKAYVVTQAYLYNKPVSEGVPPVHEWIVAFDNCLDGNLDGEPDAAIIVGYRKDFNDLNIMPFDPDKCENLLKLVKERIREGSKLTIRRNTVPTDCFCGTPM